MHPYLDGNIEEVEHLVEHGNDHDPAPDAQHPGEHARHDARHHQDRRKLEKRRDFRHGVQQARGFPTVA